MNTAVRRMRRPKTGEFVYSRQRVERLRRTATRAGRVTWPAPDGWSPLGDEPLKLLAAFRDLHLKSGFTLGGYYFRQGGNANGVVYGLPAGGPLPSPELCAVDNRRFLSPPVPSAAVSDVMDVIEGPDTPWSYLAASILVRELHELGADWHGCDWSTHTILDSDPLGLSSLSDFNPERPSGFLMISDAADWMWDTDRPSRWEPVVTMEQKTVRVVFFTYSGLGVEAIYHHVDGYRRRHYCPETTRTVVARGASGFMF